MVQFFGDRSLFSSEEFSRTSGGRFSLRFTIEIAHDLIEVCDRVLNFVEVFPKLD